MELPKALARRALRGGRLVLRAGEVRALLGENGGRQEHAGQNPRRGF